MKHTPTPWSFDSSEFRKFHINGATHANIVTVHNGWYDSEESSKGLSGNEIRANAAFIVKACNNHEKLLDMAKKSYARLLSLGQYEGRLTIDGQGQLNEFVNVIAEIDGRDPEDVQASFEVEAIKQAEEL